MNGALAQEANAAAMGGPGGYPPGGGMPAGLTQGQGSPPPTALGGQQPAGAAPGQPTPGFEQMASQMLQVLVQGNEADLQIFGQLIAQLQSMVEDRQGQAQPGMQQAPPAAPPGVTVP